MNDRIDKVGRIVIPKRLRQEVGLETGAILEFVAMPEAQGVLVKRGEGDFCVSCGAAEDLISLSEDVFLCRSCAKKQVIPEI